MKDCDDLQLLELFCGRARITRLALLRGLKARGFDINFKKPQAGVSSTGKKRRSAFDFNGDAGFANHGAQKNRACFFEIVL